jgi:hypothetical protein
MAVRRGTNSFKVVRYLQPAIGRVPYATVFGNTVPDNHPFYAVSKPAPDIEVVKAHDIACTGVYNLALRRVGKRVPFADRPNTQYDGGTPAYWSYFFDYSEAFDLQKAKRWANETGAIVLILRRFRSANLDQGHAAGLLPKYTDGENYVLHAIHGHAGPYSGLNWGWTIEQSHAGYYFERMVHPHNFIEYSGDEF